MEFQALRRCREILASAQARPYRFRRTNPSNSVTTTALTSGMEVTIRLFRLDGNTLGSGSLTEFAKTNISSKQSLLRLRHSGNYSEYLDVTCPERWAACSRG